VTREHAHPAEDSVVGLCDDGLDAYIAELAARAPPLTAEQCDKLALLLGSGQRRRAA